MVLMGLEVSLVVGVNNIVTEPHLQQIAPMKRDHEVIYECSPRQVRDENSLLAGVCPRIDSSEEIVTRTNLTSAAHRPVSVTGAAPSTSLPRTELPV